MRNREQVMLLLPVAQDRGYVSNAEQRRYVFQHSQNEFAKVRDLGAKLCHGLEYKLLETLGVVIVSGPAEELTKLCVSGKLAELGVQVAEDATFTTLEDDE